ncbi:MAG: SDR family NAD(P)-dependent oxidoreductase [Thermoanaerobaculales bacterium]
MADAKEQVVLITGCSSGIGKALAEEFIRAGHRVVATARRLEAVAGLVGPRVLTTRLDVTQAHDIERVVGEALVWAGRIDILVNNAGSGLIGPTAEIDLVALRRQFETNVVGPVALIQAVFPQFVAQGSGRIVNIGSVSGVTATPFAGAYCGSKAALHLLSDALRMELAPFGIQVTTVQPGAILSNFAARAAEGLERYHAGSLYSSIAEFIESRARLSQRGDATPAADLAREVVPAVTGLRPPAVLRVGKGSRLLPAIGRLPHQIRDRVLGKRFGLDRLS